MAAYNIYEAKTAFSSLVERAEKGEAITIARAGKPIARLVPIDADPQTTGNKPKRLRPGPGTMSKGWDFGALLKALDEPWSEEEQRAFGVID